MEIMNDKVQIGLVYYEYDPYGHLVTKEIKSVSDTGATYRYNIDGDNSMIMGLSNYFQPKTQEQAKDLHNKNILAQIKQVEVTLKKRIKKVNADAVSEIENLNKRMI